MSTVMALMSAGVVLTALKWPFKTALFPVIIGGSVFLLSGAELVLSLVEKEGTKKHSAMDFKLSEDVEKSVATRRTLATFGWIFGFFLLIMFFGFPIGIGLFVFLYLRVQGREKWPMVIILTGASLFFFWGLFIWLLDTPMPDGYIVGILKALGIGG
jgi:hypothetical protein